MTHHQLKGKRFVTSYSGGKDSALALYRALSAGLVPHALLTTYNTDQGRSWFHGIPEELLNEVSRSLGIPVRLMATTGEEYERRFDVALAEFKAEGVEVCVFGDIDIVGHLEWCTKRCEKAGLIPYFPLWKQPRKALVQEFIDAGFQAMITIVDTTRLSGEVVGRVLDHEVVEFIEQCGADACGENGEYHTFVFDGPIFARKVEFSAGEKLLRGDYLIQPIALGSGG